ncbi:MAG: fasciclin domain-containing protein [Gammaproteobacteria bacterium]|nr:fasciclin domain-containing protein [Gammaproteobacteria bacterium]
MKRSIHKPLTFLGLLHVVIGFSLFLASSAIADGEEEADTFVNGMDIVATAIATDEFNTLTTALEAADLVETLQGPGPFTVFAPTDAAFAKLPEGTLETLLKPENRAELVALLTHHVVPGRVTAKRAAEMSRAKTANGSYVSLFAEGGDVKVDYASVISADVIASNGVIHIIDAVVVP